MPKKKSTKTIMQPRHENPAKEFLANMENDLDNLIGNSMPLAEALKDATVLPEHLLLCLFLDEKYKAYLATLFTAADQCDSLVSSLIKLLTPVPDNPDRIVNALPKGAQPDVSQLFIALAGELRQAFAAQTGYCLPPLVLKHLMNKRFCGTLLRKFGFTLKKLDQDIADMARDYPEALPSPPKQSGKSEIDELPVAPLAKKPRQSKTTLGKPRQTEESPASSPKCMENMRRDWKLLWNDATIIAARHQHAQILPEHFMLALLTFPAYRADLERFFNHSERPLDWMLQRLNQHLKELPHSNRTGRPVLSPEAKQLKHRVMDWAMVPFKGYTLPYLCLTELQELITPDDNYPADLLAEAQLDQVDFYDEMYYLEFNQVQEFAEGYVLFGGQERSPLWTARTQMNRDVSRLIRGGDQIARSMNQKYVMPEHYLLFLIEEPKYHYYLRNLLEVRYGGRLWQYNQLTMAYLMQNAEAAKGKAESPTMTPASEKFIEWLRNGIHVATRLCFPALALRSFFEVECKVRDIFKDFGVTVEKLNQEIQSGFGARLPSEDSAEADEQPGNDHEDEIAFDNGGPAEEIGSCLEKFATELVEEARQGRIDAMVGRSEELERLIEVLHKKRASNAIIVGKEGVGKTAVVEGLALRIANGQVPDSIKDFKLYSVSIADMVAGAEFRGVFEKRLTRCLKESMAQGKNFLFFDEIHNLLGAGTNSGALDASSILKPYLARGQIRCIGATTYEDYQRAFSGNRAFARRFMKISLAEPNQEETLQILQGLASHYEKYHNVTYSPKILQTIVELTARYVTDKFFPDKAIDVMDECGAHYHSGIGTGKSVTAADVERVVCRMANLPSITAPQDDRAQLRGLDARLRQNIFGQDEAISELVRRVKVARAGFQDPRRPLLTAFLCGPTGCGKTELARQLAAELGCAFVKLDMSEYGEEYAASRLIGSAPGYVGYDRPGALTEPVIQTPNCVLLLDEIEKANAAVFNLLLQVLDEGRLTDNKGREASFRNAIILLTSNAGSRDAESANNLLGFARTDADQARNRQEIIQRVMKKSFPPEFRNRLQVTVMMNELALESLRQIVRKSLRLANEQLAKQKVTIQLTDQAVEKIARLAEQEHLGGRPVERLFDQHVKQKLVDEILFGKLARGGQVTVDWQAEKFQYKV